MLCPSGFVGHLIIGSLQYFCQAFSLFFSFSLSQKQKIQLKPNLIFLSSTLEESLARSEALMELFIVVQIISSSIFLEL